MISGNDVIPDGAFVALYWTTLGIWSGFVLLGLTRYALALREHGKLRKEHPQGTYQRMFNMVKVHTVVFLLFLTMVFAAVIWVGELDPETVYRVLVGRFAAIGICYLLYWLLGRQESSFKDEYREMKHQAHLEAQEERRQELEKALKDKGEKI